MEMLDEKDFSGAQTVFKMETWGKDLPRHRCIGGAGELTHSFIFPITIMKKKDIKREEMEEGGGPAGGILCHLGF